MACVEKTLSQLPLKKLEEKQSGGGFFGCGFKAQSCLSVASASSAVGSPNSHINLANRGPPEKFLFQMTIVVFLKHEFFGILPIKRWVLGPLHLHLSQSWWLPCNQHNAANIIHLPKRPKRQRPWGMPRQLLLLLLLILGKPVIM